MSNPIDLRVCSETGFLRTIMVHKPGPEVDLMPPSLMEDLLFDDILHGKEAREEHAAFRDVLALAADEVLDSEVLLKESIEDSAVKEEVLTELRSLINLDGGAEEVLREAQPDEFAHLLVSGIPNPEYQGGGLSTGSPQPFLLNPVPNLLFMRDPSAVVGEDVIVSSMHSLSRWREPFLMHTIFTYHPRFSQVKEEDLVLDYKATYRNIGGVRPTIEGGDVLVISDEILMVGVSERTNKEAIEYLARCLKQDTPYKTLIVVEMIKQRSSMHLDTVFTLISEEECLVYPPMILAGGAQQAKVYSLDLTAKELSYKLETDLLGALKVRGMDLKPINCGGDNPINQEREQWTDGANAFCLRPGAIVGYDRNPGTAEELDKAGYEVVHVEDIQSGKRVPDLRKDGKYLIRIWSNELSRARGGPRCMTMPLFRE